MRCKPKGRVIAALICAIIVTSGSTAFADIEIDLGRGQVTVYVPDSYDPEIPLPLICVLHGYGNSGAGMNDYYGFLPLSEEYGFIYCFPDGTMNPASARFWNATDACCDFYDSGVDDSGYLRALVDEIRTQLSVDPRRIHFAGLSNGGFMSHRMACDHADIVASIVSQAGATWYDPANCAPASPVHVLQVHGTADNVVLYGGGFLNGEPYPGAVTSVEQWAASGGCEIIGIETPPMLDLDAGSAGADTEVYRYDTGCDLNGSAELWKILGGSHVPPLTENFAPLVIEWMLAHPKDEITGVEDALVSTPVGAVLLSASPNPFNPRTTVAFDVRTAGHFRVTIQDVRGHLVTTLLNETLPVGRHEVTWNGRDTSGREVPSGVYLSRLEAGGRVAHGRMTLVR